MDRLYSEHSPRGKTEINKSYRFSQLGCLGAAYAEKVFPQEGVPEEQSRRPTGAEHPWEAGESRWIRLFTGAGVRESLGEAHIPLGSRLWARILHRSPLGRACSVTQLTPLGLTRIGFTF